MRISKPLILAVSSFFYVGYLPLIPGTFASAVGVLLFYLVKYSLVNFALLLSVLIILGFLVSGRAEKIIGRKDPRCVVIDEVCGMLVSFILIPYDVKLIIIGFLIFRLLDTLKPYPAYSMQDLKGSLGIMSDDLIAGMYTNIILQVALISLASFKTS
jgi:phosphatidylglycerophosphatase A